MHEAARLRLCVVVQSSCILPLTTLIPIAQSMANSEGTASEDDSTVSWCLACVFNSPLQHVGVGDLLL